MLNVTKSWVKAKSRLRVRKIPSFRVSKEQRLSKNWAKPGPNLGDRFNKLSQEDLLRTPSRDPGHGWSAWVGQSQSRCGPSVMAALDDGRFFFFSGKNGKNGDVIGISWDLWWRMVMLFGFHGIYDGEVGEQTNRPAILLWFVILVTIVDSTR